MYADAQARLTYQIMHHESQRDAHTEFWNVTIYGDLHKISQASYQRVLLFIFRIYLYVSNYSGKYVTGRFFFLIK